MASSRISGSQMIRRTAAWIREHPVKTVLVACALLLAVELMTVPWWDIADLRSANPSETALMRQRQNEAKGKGYAIHHRWLPLRSMSPHLVSAVVVAEDGTFYTHSGVDWYEVGESLEKNIERRRIVRGASTITQQLAKNLYLSTSRDPLRKFKELLITLLLEYHLSKERILELYLNVIEWGKGVYGAEAASRQYYGKSSSELTLDEALGLAAVIPSPRKHRPDENSDYLQRRKQIILQRLKSRKAYAPEELSSTPVVPTRRPIDIADSLSGEHMSDSLQVTKEDG